MFKNLFGSKKEEPTPTENQVQNEVLDETTSLDQATESYEDVALEDLNEWDVTLEDGLLDEPTEFDDEPEPPAPKIDPEYLLNAPQIVGWGSTQEQELLFSALLLFYSPEMSILDVGCGRADLYGYLTRLFQTEIPYKGIDYNPNLLIFAKEKYPSVNVKTLDILNLSEKHDWVVGSGLFNIKEQEDLTEYAKQCIDKMYESANIGIAFNMLTGYPDNIADEDKAVLASHSPSVWLDYLIGKYTKVICRTDYMLDDVTFFILK
jgi:SAM-dependent methyltransferase